MTYPPCPKCSMGTDYPKLRQCGYGTTLQCPVCQRYYDRNGNPIVGPVDEKSDETTPDDDNWPSIWG